MQRKRFRHLFFALAVLLLMQLFLPRLFGVFLDMPPSKDELLGFPDKLPAHLPLGSLLGTALATLATAIVAIKLWWRESVWELSVNGKDAVRLTMAGLIAAAALAIFNTAFDSLDKLLLPEPTLIEEVFRSYARAAVKSNAIAPFMFWMVLLAPVAEELFFRGVIYRVSKEYMPVALAALFSAAIFAMFHVHPRMMLPVFVGGIIFAYLYERTKALLPCMVAHSVVNFISALQLFREGGLA